MSKIATSLLAAGLAALAVPAAQAQTQIARTFVSAAIGNDANDCNRNTPCRTFQHAHDLTLPAGEITILDPGGYGAVTINRAISIINDGVGEAGVLVSGGFTGITISAGASDAVSLRGLTIKGIGFGGGNGIVLNSGAALTVENCAVRTLTGVVNSGEGIVLQSFGSSHLAILNTIVADNQGNGIRLSPLGSGTTTATLSHVQMINNGFIGLSLITSIVSSATINAVVEDSIAAKNGTGFQASGPSAAATLTIVRSTIAHNGSGGAIHVANAAGTLRIGQSTLTDNAVTWVNESGKLQSFGDNNIIGNADGDPAIPTIIGKK
jgi:hypothetical protein